ncbi:MAG: fumarylacetoacetate hydrolase family protein [Bacteroidetes bacterium]|nr:fumarylacetoacetate hydrolase family protein [Bacteroidota bacterium]MBS1932710.1 fumarylacetoacetate hydrolase family protein [Bacteroidota bacterium]
MHLYKTTKGNVLIDESKSYLLKEEWNSLINQKNLFAHLSSLKYADTEISKAESDELIRHHLLAPIGNQEVWAAGVTYMRSRDARMEESKNAGGGDFYQKVYEAERPELFFKALAHRVVAHKQQVNIRKDSTWNVPEPELTLFINSSGEIQAYTIGNDMSSRSIEGENPLYLPQAKSYERSAALGPGLYIPEKPISKETIIHLQITRNGNEVFAGSISLNRMKRELTQLASFLFRECDFINGCFLMTGTGIVPPDHFTLQINDEVNISIEGIGMLSNIVGIK